LRDPMKQTANRSIPLFLAAGISALAGSLVGCGTKDSTTKDASGGSSSAGAEGGSAANGGTAGSGNAGDTGGKVGATGGTGGTAPTGGTGGTASVGGAGGTGMGGASACGTVPFCDSFETYAVGTNPRGMGADANWSIATGTDKVLVDDSRAFVGKKSIKIPIPVTGDSSVNQMLTTIRKDLFPAAKIYARMMVYFDGLPTGPSPLHWSMMRAEGVFPASSGLPRGSASLGFGGWRNNASGGFQQVMNGSGGADGSLDCWNHANQQIPTGKWTCVEWSLDSATHATEVKVGGVVSPQMSFALTPKGGSTGCVGLPKTVPWYVPPVLRFSIGYVHWHISEVAHTMWIDDVALSKDGPIGCPAAPL
jgi:hypothetical protein